MTTVKTIEESVSLPLELGPSAERDIPLPAAVVFHIVHSKLWHLIAWSDPASNSCGLWLKGMAIALPRDRLTGLSIEMMRPAKGGGWVALEARLAARPVPVTLMQCVTFQETALAWLNEHRQRLASAFDCVVTDNDYGCDY
jgi:hypothetical protein